MSSGEDTNNKGRPEFEEGEEYLVFTKEEIKEAEKAQAKEIKRRREFNVNFP